MHFYRILTTTIILLLTCCTISSASDRYVISAKAGNYLILKLVEVDQKRIKHEKSVTVDTHYPIVSTAVLPRKISNSATVFDVYFATCLDPNDFECINATLSLIRFDSELQALDRKDLTVPVRYSLSIERFDGAKGFIQRLFIANRGEVTERKLRKDGVPYQNAFNVGVDGDHYGAMAAEDGRMAVSISQNNDLQIWLLHPRRPMQSKQVNEPFTSPTFSGSVTPKTEAESATSTAAPYRFVFYRTFQDTNSRVVHQKVDEAGDFVGRAKGFTDYTETIFYDVSQSIAVTQDARLVLYTSYDPSCKKHVLKGQRFEPQTQEKIGSPKLLVGCDDVPANSYGIQGIAITALPRDHNLPNSFAGKWKIKFQGDCPAEGRLTIDSYGAMKGEILSPCEYLGGLHKLLGTLSVSGDILNGVIEEFKDFNVGSMSGKFSPTKGSGTYQYFYGDLAGKWSAVKEE